MTRLTVYKNPDGPGYLVDLQADINSHFATRVVAPLLPVEEVPFYASALNPVFEIEGARFVMATQGMAAVPLAILKHPVSSLEHRRTEVVAAIDLLFQGFGPKNRKESGSDPLYGWAETRLGTVSETFTAAPPDRLGRALARRERLASR